MKIYDEHELYGWDKHATPTQQTLENRVLGELYCSYCQDNALRLSYLNADMTVVSKLQA